MLIVFTTVPSVTDGNKLAEKIVNAHVAACVQVLPQMTSFYIWEGEMQNESEHLLLIKTLPEKYDELERVITANHSYTVPEIVAVDAEKVSGPYLEWIKNLI